MTKKIDIFDEKKITLCQNCIEDKQHKEKFHIQDVQWSAQLLELIHSDIYGLM